MFYLKTIQEEYPESRKQELLALGMYGDREDLLKKIAKISRIPYNKEEASKTEKGKFFLDLAKDEFKILI